jgi:hypothetical protein
VNRQPEDASEQHKVFQENGVIATRDLSNKTEGSR